MRAYVLTRYGGAGAMEFRDVPEPQPGPGDVRIRVAAAGLNPVDCKIRDGDLRPINRLRLPVVAGCELSGTVDAVGPGPNRFAVGDRVYARVEKHKLGAFAELVCVAQELVARMPSSIDFAAAAGLPLAGLTALQALRDELAVGPGTRLFIAGGAGGVGTLAIQLAKHWGAEVTTTASPRGEALVRRLGADRVIDYTREDFSLMLRNFDAVLDLVGGTVLKDSFSILRPGGRVVSIAGVPEAHTATEDLGAPPWITAAFTLMSRGIRRRARRAEASYRYLFMHPSGDDLRVLASLVDGGQLRPVVDSTYPFARIAEAFAALEQGHAKGKIAVTLGP
ncbi:2-haloacrylate reductase [Arthrobacter sp. SO5]|uniref:NADP-dependent oxidoreductase n=1 Tax=Arthrobacter sp. SO5 TaxID=1897055 RepID=UPI001E5AB31A|nr:NADP-dependent oxidoreductase [Arthrobacter sp. SO5]MCB5274137.1 2-haloacrylate reductase [Arthrobacter sp. SO5]